MCGADKRCTFHNKGWLEFTGRTAAEALQDNWPDHIHPNDRERCYETYAAAFDAGRDYQFECRLRRADGEYRWFLNRGVARFVDGGAFAGYIGCSLEITELKRGYEQHLGTQKLESVGILAAGVAHEFNNALGAIAALAEAAQSDLPSGAPAAANLDGIQQTALRASQIASQLMTFTRHDQAPAAAVDLSALIAEMLDLLKVSISKSAVLATSLPPGLPLISANPSELRQMVMNLVINASDALEGKPGTISIAAAPVEHKGVEAVRLEVADTGRGMAPDTRERIFDPFFTTRSMGRGLGLFAVQGIVRRLGGAIEVQSSLNSGSRFVVLLPRHAGPAPQAWTNGASANGAVHTRPITVLFVDDEDSLRSSIARLLRKQNFQVIEAADGPSAIDVFNNSDRAGIDIILLDVTLPGMRGVDVLDGLRRLRPDVKVVLCTAYSEEIARVEFVNREIHGFIRKPYRAADLVKLLSRCVED
jgi:PAS domain S-box-containing protein